MDGQNCLTFVNQIEPNLPEVPRFDVAGDRLSYPLTVLRDGQRLEFRTHLRVPTAERLCRFLTDREGYATQVKGKDAGVDVELMVTSDHDVRFFDEHLIAVTYGKATLTKEQLDTLDRIHFIRTSVITKGMLRVAFPIPKEDADTAAEMPSLEELLGEKPHVEQMVLLGDDNGEEHEVKLVHHFEPPTAKQSTDFRRLQKMRFRDHGVRKVITKFSEIVKLYDAMIHHVDGVVGDVTAIRHGLPAQWKINAVQQLFAEAERKNG